MAKTYRSTETKKKKRDKKTRQGASKNTKWKRAKKKRYRGQGR
jgi:hypothetical protein